MADYNVVVINDNLKGNEDLIQPMFDSEDIMYLNDVRDIYDILVTCKIFSSKGQARKNWTRTGPEIPKGLTDLTGIGKLSHRLVIWNPIKEDNNGTD